MVNNSSHARKTFTVPRQLSQSTESKIVVAVIDHRTLDRECLVRTIETSSDAMIAKGYHSIDVWVATADAPPRIVFYRVGGSEADTSSEIRRVVTEADQVPVVVISDSDDIGDMIDAFDGGAKGYLPSSVGLETIFEATQLSLTNGIFLPVTSLKTLSAAFVRAPKQDAVHAGQFTERQLSVCEALRRGKSNKSIAYELNLCESTVKVHVRAIMKRLRATNRTEAAFKLNAVFFGNEG